MISQKAARRTGNPYELPQAKYPVPDDLIEEFDADIKAVAFVSGMFYATRRDLIGLVYPSDLFGKRKKDKTFRQYMNPENEEVISHLPPAVLTTSRNDFLRKYTIKYAGALKKSGVRCRCIYYAEENKQLGHAFVTLHPDLPESADACNKIDKWFRGNTK